MKFIFTIIITLLIGITSLTAQLSSPVRFSVQNSLLDLKESFLLGLPNNDLIMFWIDWSGVKSSRSNNEGSTWSSENLIISNQSVTEINSVVMTTGRILLIFRDSFYSYLYSDDNGFTWVSGGILPLRDGWIQKYNCYYASLSVLESGLVSCTYSFSPTGPSNPTPLGIYSVFSSDGINWSPFRVIDENGFYSNMVSVNNFQDMVVYQDTLNGISNLYYRISTDNGNTWLAKQSLYSSSTSNFKPRIVKNNTNKLFLYFQKFNSTTFPQHLQSEVYFLISTNSGTSWIGPEKFTNYVGQDSNHSVSLWNGKPVLSFTSSRNYKPDNYFMQIYFGTLPDISSPPFLFNFVKTPEDILPNQPVNIKAYVDDNSGIDSVFLLLRRNAFDIDTIRMFDNGLSGDSLAGDKIYGIILSGFPEGFGALYTFLIYDSEMNIAEFNGGDINVPLDNSLNSFRMNINRFNVPFDNNGIIADVYPDSLQGGLYDESTVLFSGGFYLSGKVGNTVWAASQASAIRVQDYQAGVVGSSPNDPKNQLYIIKASDPHFGESWQNYKYAVPLGAYFYDGNNDGIYNPVDLNGNGIWDLNEDRPDMLGDVTLWCVYNDGVPSNLRRFRNMYPLGVEIKQTVFALGENLAGPIENMLFVRYIINNTGSVVQEIDSVFFGEWADPDIGDYDDDIGGCDTLINTGYAYNSGIDQIYGNNPPSIGITLLQGNIEYISGVTFIDNNGNGIYDPGVDNPIDTAFVNNGLFIGSQVYPGARNQNMLSFMSLDRYFYGVASPNNEYDVRYHTMGLKSNGQPLDPCTFGLGEVRGGIDCNAVNPRYMFSGDPVSDIGWISTYPADLRILNNSGPFKLKVNEPVELWFAYVVGRGIDSLDSVTKMKEHIEYAGRYYKSNFTYLPSDAEEKIIIPGKFELYQNYPNPFNPTTTIRYELPLDGIVTIEVFDILGQKVRTLLNEFKKADRYEIDFNASALSSGIYFYKLQAGSFVQTKKMVLLK